MDSDLYELVVERASGRCEIPSCAVPRPRLEVAHLKGKGMGGSKFRDHEDNLAALCKMHHDILDGRVSPTSAMFKMRHELELLYRDAIGREWKGRR